MSARAIFKASLDLGPVEIPVKLYAAAEDRDVHFRLLHAKDRVPVRQQMVDPRDEREVLRERMRFGLELDGRMVMLSPAELEAARPKPSRKIEVTRFVPRAAIDVSWYRRPYFLGPDGAAADYGALLEALRASERYGIARWVMRGARYFGALAWRDDRLQLVALHDAAEVVALDELATPKGAAASAQEKKLAEQLVAMLEGPFDPAELRDEYRERVEKLVAARKKGRRFQVEEALPRATRGELGAALERSIRAAKRQGRAAA